MPSDERFDRVVTEADLGCRSQKSFTGINGTTEVVLFHSVSFPPVLFVSCGLVFAGNCRVFWRTAEAGCLYMNLSQLL
jgi:hypothetical protein